MCVCVIEDMYSAANKGGECHALRGRGSKSDTHAHDAAEAED
jgi:hypothetical protein